MFRMRPFPMVGILVGIVLIGAVPSVQAAPEFGVKIQVGSQSVFVYDGSVSDGDSSAGAIEWSGTLDGVFFRFTLTTTNSPGTNELAELSIDGINIQNNSGVAKSIMIAAAANGYTTGLDANPLALALTGAGIVKFGASGGTSNITYTAFADTGDDAVQDDLSGLSFPFGSATASVSDSVTLGSSGQSTQSFELGATLHDAFDPSSAYALAGQFDLTLSNGASFNLLGGKTNVFAPEPGSLAMLCAGVPIFGLAGVCWRRRKFA
jgi:hypothetical protein